MARRRPRTAFALALLAAGCLVLSAQPDRTAQILSRAREAVGGAAALEGVTALSVKGTSRSTVDGSARPFLVPSSVGAAPFANLEVTCQLPDKFLVDREWPTAFAREIGGFNGNRLLAQSREANGPWIDTPLGDARNDGRAVAMRVRELLRCLVAWLLTVPEPYQVRFTDAGVADSGHGRADVLDATGPDDFSARLSFDPETHRLLMITYREPPAPSGNPAARRSTAGAGEPLFKSLEMPTEGMDINHGDIRMLLADYKREDGILFPHKVRFEIQSLAEEWTIARFKVNPRFEPDQFAPRTSK